MYFKISDLANTFGSKTRYFHICKTDGNVLSKSWSKRRKIDKEHVQIQCFRHIYSRLLTYIVLFTPHSYTIGLNLWMRKMRLREVK